MSLRTQDFKSRASASFATPALCSIHCTNGELALPARHCISRRRLKAGDGTRTRDPNLGKVVLYQLSYSRKNPKLTVVGSEG